MLLRATDSSFTGRCFSSVSSLNSIFALRYSLDILLNSLEQLAPVSMGFQDGGRAGTQPENLGDVKTHPKKTSSLTWISIYFCVAS